MKKLSLALSTILLLSISSMGHATVITFDDLIVGETSYDFDADLDGQIDVTFSTDDVFGFNTVGPGENQQFVDEPALEGTTELAPDLRVDFLAGVEGTLSFGFAVSSGSDVMNAITFSVFDMMNNLINSVTVDALLGSSDFPENIVSLTFDGVGAYATFDFDNSFASRYIIDNFEGDFGTSERPPIVDASAPFTMSLVGLALVGLMTRRRK